MRRAIEIGRARAGEPRSISAIVGGVCILAGMVAILIAWRGADATSSVRTQLAFVVSGGVGGIALALIGAGVILGAVIRETIGREQRVLEEAADAAHAVAEALRTPPRTRSGPPRRRRAKRD